MIVYVSDQLFDDGSDDSSWYLNRIRKIPIFGVLSGLITVALGNKKRYSL